MDTLGATRSSGLLKNLLNSGLRGSAAVFQPGEGIQARCIRTIVLPEAIIASTHQVPLAAVLFVAARACPLQVAQETGARVANSLGSRLLSS
jgi:hypothetical protein